MGARHQMPQRCCRLLQQQHLSIQPSTGRVFLLKEPEVGAQEADVLGQREFLEWFREIDMPPEIDWIIVEDFNILRRPEDRNKEGADPNEMFRFNEAISKLGLIELPLHGRQFTWTNKQFPPLLERLDWFFTSNSWTTQTPSSEPW